MTEHTLNPRDMEAQIIARALKDSAFRDQLIAAPRQALASMGIDLPEGIQVQVIEQTPNMLYLVLPARPEPLSAEAELSESLLAQVVGGGTGACAG